MSENGIDLAGPVGEQVTASVRADLGHVTRPGQRQRRQPVAGLPAHPQRFPAGDEDAQVVGRRQQLAAQVATAPSTCSQLSRISSRRREASTRASTAGGTRLLPHPQRRRHLGGHVRRVGDGASATRHTPSGNGSAMPRHLTASRVLPTPPGPVTVTSRS